MLSKSIRNGKIRSQYGRWQEIRGNVFKTALRFLSLEVGIKHFLTALLVEIIFSFSLIRRFPQFWLMFTLTSTFLRPALLGSQQKWEGLKCSILSIRNYHELSMAVEVGQIESTFHYMWSIYRLQIGKIAASAMQIYTVFKGTIHKGSTLKYKNNLGIRPYSRVHRAELL